MVRSGKTKNAKRNLPLTKETYESLLQRYVEQGRPQRGWVFRAPTKSGHIEESSIRKQHCNAIRDAGLEHFELYCFRHTFLSILGASGCDPYTLVGSLVTVISKWQCGTVTHSKNTSITHSTGYGLLNKKGLPLGVTATTTRPATQPRWSQ